MVAGIKSQDIYEVGQLKEKIFPNLMKGNYQFDISQAGEIKISRIIIRKLKDNILFDEFLKDGLQKGKYHIEIGTDRKVNISQISNRWIQREELE